MYMIRRKYDSFQSKFRTRIYLNKPTFCQNNTANLSRTNACSEFPNKNNFLKLKH